jgi:hypothetical protein
MSEVPLQMVVWRASDATPGGRFDHQFRHRQNISPKSLAPDTATQTVDLW